MSGQNRTFVLQVVGVATLVAVIFFAFLRPSDPGDLAGIDAPGGETPQFGLPGLDRNDGDRRNGPADALRGADRGGSDGTRLVGTRAVASGTGPTGGPGPSPTGDGPPGDQYTSTAVALMERVRDAPGGDR
jgi:hypothetical protein